mgnify:CR=1 FL=1
MGQDGITPNNFSTTRAAEEKVKSFIEEFHFSDYSTHIYNDINVEKGILHFMDEENNTYTLTELFYKYNGR